MEGYVTSSSIRMKRFIADIEAQWKNIKTCRSYRNSGCKGSNMQRNDTQYLSLSLSLSFCLFPFRTLSLILHIFCDVVRKLKRNRAQTKTALSKSHNYREDEEEAVKDDVKPRKNKQQKMIPTKLTAAMNF